MTSKALILLVAISVVFGMSGFVIAQANDTVIINVTVGTLTQITVLPTSLNWTNITPGTAGGVLNLTVKNTGSVNVSNMFAYVNTNETEPSRPYQSSDPLNYSSGSILLLRNTTVASNVYYWVQRKEWNWTTNIPNSDFSNVDTADTTLAAFGFLINTSLVYVWAVGANATNGRCNETGATFGIEDDFDTGAISTRTPLVTSITQDGVDASYGYYQVDRASAPIANTCVAVRHDCTYILIYKYDKRSGFSTCTNTEFLQAPTFAPSVTINLFADVWVPLGIPAGQMMLSTLTIEAS
jgi:hypothetical protein